MISKLHPLLASILVGASLCAQTPLPYFTGFDNAAQKTGWTEYRKGSTSNGGWDYTSLSAYTAPSALVHSFPVGGTAPTTDWFVSPAFNFSNGGRIDSIRRTFAGFGSPGESDTIAIYLLTGSPDPSLASSAVLLYDFKTNYTKTGEWELDSGINIPSKSGSSYIAFKYSTTENWLDVSFDNIRISGKTNTGIRQIVASSGFTIYPNPTADYVEMRFPANTSALEIYDHCGALVYQENVNNLTQTILTTQSFKNGIYHVRFIAGESSGYKNLVVMK